MSPQPMSSMKMKRMLGFAIAHSSGDDSKRVKSSLFMTGKREGGFVWNLASRFILQKRPPATRSNGPTRAKAGQVGLGTGPTANAASASTSMRNAAVLPPKASELVRWPRLSALELIVWTLRSGTSLPALQ